MVSRGAIRLQIRGVSLACAVLPAVLQHSALNILRLSNTGGVSKYRIKKTMSVLSSLLLHFKQFQELRED